MGMPEPVLDSIPQKILKTVPRQQRLTVHLWTCLNWIRWTDLPPPVFSGYEGVPEFFTDLLNHITSVLQSHNPDFAPAGEQPKGLPVSTTVPIGAPPAPCCCNMLGKEAGGSPWIVEGDGGLKGSRQRLGCNSAMSPNFQQHCVSTMATKASSQWLIDGPRSVCSLNKKWLTMVTIIMNNNHNNYDGNDANISNQPFPK